MKGKFNTIKKSRKKSKDIDEKIEYLNKECQKTGLQEVMTTSNIYQGSTKVPNQDYNNFNGLSQGGYALGLSGADGNSLGNATIGINPSTNQSGVALSPPHPVSGTRRVASTVTDGIGSNRALRPGIGTRVRGTNDDGSPRVITDGSAVWFFHQPTDQWYNFEYLDGELGFWDTNFLGFFFHNTNLDDFQLSGVNVGTQIKNKIDSINFGANGEIGAPQTTVLTQTKLDDSGFLPINIDLSIQAFNSLKEKAKGFFDEIKTRFEGVQGVLDATPPFIAFLIHQVNKNSPWTAKNPFPVKINEAETNAIRGDIEEIFKEWGNDRVDEINDGSPMTKEEQNQINERLNRNKTDGRGDALDAEYAGYRLTMNNIGKPDAFKGNIKTNKDGSKSPTAIDDNFVFEGDADASVAGAPEIIKFMLQQDGVQSAIEKSGLDYPYRKDNEDPIDDFGTKEEILNKNMHIKLNLTTTSSLRESLDESVKLGHFEPEVLNVDIEQLRKGIMPEFPKDPPPEMIDGYSAKSRLAPKKIEKDPFIKITKKDLAKNHKLTDKEISDFMNDIKMINDYIKKNPADLIYAQQRYPKHDPRLAQLNWQMDQMLDAGKEYIDKQFPENQKLFDKIKKKIKNTIDQTDPKNFKGTKLPKFDKTHLEDFKRKKEVYSRFMKKPVKTKKLFQKKGLTYK